MARLSPDLIKKVSEQVDILPIIENYVELKKRGKNYFGFCPFHDERTPSFSVSPDKQLFHCFSCGRGGNVFGFIQEIEQIAFPEAVKKVADLAQLDVNIQLDSNYQPQSSKYELSYDLLNRATRFYQHMLNHTIAGEVARTYLKDRGISTEIIETFQLGFAPQNRTLLQEIYAQNELDDRTILNQTGLFTDSSVNESNNNLVSRFFDRLIIPLRNDVGQTIGFSGRTISSMSETEEEFNFQQAKYINSPESDLFHKSQFLFNMDQAKKAIRRENEVLLLEGYMDVIAVYQAGIQQAVASMGTSLTQEQILKIRPLTNHVIIAYDSDAAGLKATDRAIKMLRDIQHFDISILSFPSGMDPDDYIRLNGIEAFKNHYQHKRETPFEFYKRFYSQNYQLSNSNEVSKYIEQLLPELQFEKRLVQKRFLKDLSDEYQLDEDILIEMFEAIPVKQKQRKAYTPSAEPITELPSLPDQLIRAQKQLMFRLLTNEDAWHLIDFNHLSFPDENYQLLFWVLEVFHQQYEAPFHIQDVLIELNNQPELEQLLVDISYFDLDKAITRDEIDDLVEIITTRQDYEKEIERLKKEIKDLYTRGENQLATSLGQQLIELIRRSQSK